MGWVEIAKPNIMILKTNFLNVGQRLAYAQPPPWVFCQKPLLAGGAESAVNEHLRMALASGRLSYRQGRRVTPVKLINGLHI